MANCLPNLHAPRSIWPFGHQENTQGMLDGVQERLSFRTTTCKQQIEGTTTHR